MSIYHYISNEQYISIGRYRTICPDIDVTNVSKVHIDIKISFE